jgi:hypothetical protein
MRPKKQHSSQSDTDTEFAQKKFARELADDAAQPVTLRLLSFKKCNMKASDAGKKVKFEV